MAVSSRGVIMQLDLLDHIAAKPVYPAHAGFKDTGAGKMAAEKITKSGRRQTLEEKVIALFVRSPRWTPDEAASALGLEVGDIRPRFSELCSAKRNARGEIVRPVFLHKSTQLRESKRDNPQHVYVKI